MSTKCPINVSILSPLAKHYLLSMSDKLYPYVLAKLYKVSGENDQKRLSKAKKKQNGLFQK